MLIYESGAVGAEPERLPVSIGDPSLVTGSLMVCGMADVFQFLLQNGRIEVGFLGGAQIDRYGNINTTVVGDYDAPDRAAAGKRRRRGDRDPRPPHRRHLAAQPARVSRRRWTSSPAPAIACAAAPASELGMPGAGPVRVVTDKGILEADPETGELVLGALYPGTTADEVRAGVGWPLRCPRPLRRRGAPGRARSFGCCARCSIPTGSI